MAKKGCFPTVCSGGLEPRDGWVERLAGNRYGRHAAWFAPAPENGNGESVEMIPWLLFNRHLWEELPEQHLGADQDTLSLDVPHRDTENGGHPGWKVAMRLDTGSFAPNRIIAVRADEEAAPGGNDFLPLAAGRVPPPVPASAAAGRQRRGLMAVGTLVLAAAAAFGAWRLVAGDSATQQAVNDLTMRKAAAAAVRVQLMAQLQSAGGGGLPAAEAFELALSAMNQGGAVRWENGGVRWQGVGAPPGFECGATDEEGWRPCQPAGGG